MKFENSKTCENCDGKCCRYVAMEIDCPETREDFENIRWYVTHENVVVYVEEDGTWNLEFMTKCRHLGENNKCGIYEKRPAICREYNHEECTFHNNYNELFTFKTIEDVDTYLKEIFDKGLHVVPKTEGE